ncbi:MAG: hypothetical protein ABIH49_02075 [archaeon]
MKRGFFLIGFALIFLMISGVFAEQLSSDVQNFVKKVAGKKGINENEISNVSQVDFSNLPKEINLQNIDDTNLALYKVETIGNKSVFVVTLSNENYKKISQQSSSVSLLNFGFDGESNESLFLKTSTGVSGDLERGYVMLRAGSITGISTNIEITKEGNVEIIIFKNGKALGFENSFSGTGVKNDFDTQSEGVVTFQPGDVISVYAKSDTSFRDISTLLEITN